MRPGAQHRHCTAPQGVVLELACYSSGLHTYTLTLADLQTRCLPCAAPHHRGPAVFSCLNQRHCLCQMHGSDTGEAVMVACARLDPRCEALLFVVCAAACELSACDLSSVPGLALSILSHGEPLASCSGPSPLAASY